VGNDNVSDDQKKSTTAVLGVLPPPRFPRRSTPG
jgi:hypothetical protein